MIHGGGIRQVSNMRNITKRRRPKTLLIKTNTEVLTSELQAFLTLGISKTFRLCLVPGKYKGKKKNAKENDFLMFGCPMKNIKENQI